MQKVVTFRQYHKLNIDKFRSDLLAIPFVSSPSDDTDLLHEQYMSGLSGLLDIHAPVKTKQLIKPAPSWITDEYRTAKYMRRQYERAWRRDKSSVNHSCLRRQINRCNHILNRNKGRFYCDLVSDNCGDGKKLWQALNKILSQIPLSSHPLLMKNHWQTDLVRFSLIKLKRSETPSNTPNLNFFTLTRSCQLSVPFKLSLIAKSSSLLRKPLQKLAL